MTLLILILAAVFAWFGIAKVARAAWPRDPFDAVVLGRAALIVILAFVLAVLLLRGSA